MLIESTEAEIVFREAKTCRLQLTDLINLLQTVPLFVLNVLSALYFPSHILHSDSCSSLERSKFS